MMHKKIMCATTALAIIGAGVIATVMMSKKAQKRTIQLVDTIIDEADEMMG